MDQRQALIDGLRIDRDVRPERSTRRGWTARISVASIVIAAAAAWWTFAKPGDAPGNTAMPAVVAAPVRSSSTPSALDASGYVVARRQATVSAKITGRVVEMLIEEGQMVAEGDVIARLDDAGARAALEQARAQLAHAEADLLAADVALRDAEPIYFRNVRQFGAAVISAQDFDVANAAYNAAQAAVAVKARAVDVARAALAIAERLHEDTFVRAPFSGVVTVQAAQTGEIVSPSSAGGGFTRTGIGTIVDMDSLEVEVDVSESFINRVRPGQATSIRLNAYPDTALGGQVIAVVPTADRAKATVKVRVGFAEKDERALPEMGARVSFSNAPQNGEPK
jgi:RND family efflux transporter MFP subunit